MVYNMSARLVFKSLLILAMTCLHYHCPGQVQKVTGYSLWSQEENVAKWLRDFSTAPGEILTCMHRCIKHPKNNNKR